MKLKELLAHSAEKWYVSIMKDIFPYEYQGGGYFRLKGVPAKTPAPILHGEEAIKFIINKLTFPIPASIKKLEKLMKVA